MAVIDIPSLGAAAAIADAHLFPCTQGSAVAKKATATQLATYVIASDSDLSAIAALTTTTFGRSLLTLANAAALQTAAGLVIGTNVQAFDADLAAIAALATTTFGRALLTEASAATLQATLGLVIGTNVQAFDSDLAAIAALTTTAFGRSVLELADAAAARTLSGAEQLGVVAGINPQTASYTLALTDIGKVVEMNVGSGNTLTVPPSSSVAFVTGSRVDVAQIGSGQTTVTAGSGVTLRQRETKLKLAGQYAVASLYKRATDEWMLVGDVAA